jgi:uncharacterized protein (DUF983 family)
MKLQHLLVFAAIVSILYGLGLLLIPGQLFSFYGVTQTAEATLMGRLFAAALLGLGLVAWLARGIDVSATRRAIVPSFLVCALVGLIVSAHAVYIGLINPYGWSVVIIYLLLTLGFAYFQFTKP